MRRNGWSSLALAGLISSSLAVGAPALAESPSASCDRRVLFVANTAPAPAGDDSLLAGVRAVVGATCVTVTSDDAVTPDQAGTFAAVVVSSSVVPSVLGARLRDIDVPVLVSEPFLFDDFGLTTRNGRELLANAGRLGVVASPLTDSVPAIVTAFVKAGTLNYAQPSTVNSPMIGAKPVGTSYLALFGYGKGDTLADGIVAAANRAAFFAGYRTSLSTAGRDLLRSTLDWLTSGPTNDDFADAFVITGVTGSVTGTDADATVEPGEPGHPFFERVESTVWYRWTAPADGSVIFRLDDPYFPVDGGMFPDVFIGTSLTALTRPDGGVRMGDTLMVRVGNGCEWYYGCNDPGPFVLQWRYVEPPANDDLANAVGLVGNTGSITGSNLGTTLEPGEPHDPDDSLGTGSVWYRWTAPANGYLVLQAWMWDVHVATYTGGAVTTLTSVPSTGAGIEEVMIVTAGTTYRIAITGLGGAEVPFTLEWNFLRPATNDAFANAITITGPSGSTPGHNFNATLQSTEPQDSVVNGRVCATVWYRWTAPVSGYLAVVPAASSLGIDVFVGATLPTLAPFTADTVTAGSTYRFRVYSYMSEDEPPVCGERGRFELLWQVTAPT